MFQPIYYVTGSLGSVEKSVQMMEQYMLHGARAFQVDMPSQNPVYETDLIKQAMQDALKRYDGYEPYMDSFCALRQRHPEAVLHCVLYPDVIRAIGMERLTGFVKEAGVSTVMVAGGDAETLALLAGHHIATIGRIDKNLLDDQLKKISLESPDRYYNFNYKHHREQAPHGCETFQQKIAYIRNTGVCATILAVEGVKHGDMMSEVKQAGTDGALVGNALMNLWNDETALWELFEQFQAFAC